MKPIRRRVPLRRLKARAIVAIANADFNDAMRWRFHAGPMIQATELLLQERVPREAPTTRLWATEVKADALDSDAERSGGRRIALPHQCPPGAHFLSNGRYAVMLAAAGSGYSRWGEFAITRWREDFTRDDSGSWIYLKDRRSGAVWSEGFQPTGAPSDEYGLQFNEDHAQFTRRDGTLTTTLEALVSAGDDADAPRNHRQWRPSNPRHRAIANSRRGPQSADVADPAFAKLFVEAARAPWRFGGSDRPTGRFARAETRPADNGPVHNRRVLKGSRTADVGAGVFQRAGRFWRRRQGICRDPRPGPVDAGALYQTLACRVWARSAFYQVSRAQSFRNPLQDDMRWPPSGPI